MDKKCYKLQRFNLSKYLNYLIKIAAIVLVFLSLFAIISVFFRDCTKCSPSFSYDGLLSFLKFFIPFQSLFYATIITLTLSIALSSYLQSKQVDAVYGLAKLREMLSTYDNMIIHDFLENGDDIMTTKEGKSEEITKREYFQKFYYNQNKVKVYNYLGVLELSNIYIDNHIIPTKDFMSQFGYRIENVFDNEFLKKEIEKEAKYWQTLKNLHCKIVCINNN